MKEPQDPIDLSHGSAKARAVIQGYHERTKHRPQRYAAGPETLDWDAQPDPFRRWVGAPLTRLPLVAESWLASWEDMHTPGAVPCRAMDLQSVSGVLALSFGLTAWKQYGPDRWALRAHPSSGNLHPIEVYVIAVGVDGLRDGLYHYAPEVHALALRAACAPREGEVLPKGLWVGLSAILWREAWKYGERAFRYCQLDAGHALGALRYAAAVAGWQAVRATHLPLASLAELLGLTRDEDFGPAEREEAEMLIQLGPAPGLDALQPTGAGPSAAWFGHARWQGRANVLDRRPMYRWPVVEEVAAASRVIEDESADAHRRTPVMPSPGCAWADDAVVHPRHAVRADVAASDLIRTRRSAQSFDRRGQMPMQVFARMVHALLPMQAVPWDAWPHAPRVHAVFYAHRVEGLAPGAYLLPRRAEAVGVLAQGLTAVSAWQPVPDWPSSPCPLSRLVEHPTLSGTLRTLSCHQAIASDACFAVSLLAEFDAALDDSPGNYRQLHQEAGLLGQVLYMQAEAEGFRGTGIGCYFDDAVHELLGVRERQLQVLYHFTVGVPVRDTRITTEPPYAHRTERDGLSYVASEADEHHGP